MLTLKSLSFENIGRFTEPQTIDFTQLGSLVQVDAQNLNTGGSSGAGKSTIFKALEFLLGLNDISSGVLQSRLTKSPMSVTGIFDLDGQPLRIERGKKILIDLNGEITTGSAKLTEEKLDQLIGMPRELFRKILHKRQGEGGFFLELGPSETHRFLTSCLNLQKEQGKVLTLDTRLGTLEMDKVSSQSAVESHKSAIEATERAIASLGVAPVLFIDSASIELLKAKHEEAKANHKLVKDTQKKEMEDLEGSRPQVTTNPFDRSKIESLENYIGAVLVQIASLEKVELNRQSEVKSKISELQVKSYTLSASELTRQSEVKAKISLLRAEAQRLQQQEKDRQRQVQDKISSNKMERIKVQSAIQEGSRAKEEALKLTEELKKIRSSLCPVCDQNWVNEAAKAKESAVLQKLSELKKTVIVGMEAVKATAALEEESKTLGVDLAAKPIPELTVIAEQAKQLELESAPRDVPELGAINDQISQLKLEMVPQAIPEAIELKLKKDFKNQELLSARQEEKEHQNKENTKNQAILEEYAQRQTALRQSHETVIRFAQGEENKTKSERELAEMELFGYKEAVGRYDESMSKFRHQLHTYSTSLHNENIKLHNIQEEIELATESKKAIKSYLSCSFEDALDSIGDAATKLIRNIPNLSTATIQLEGLKETASGKVKEEINCVISVDGEVGVPVKSLSGGERSSLDLAIDLAVMEFIQERTGTGCNVLILDEPFTGLDSENACSIVELLRESNINKQILIVDHSPLVKETFESKITVIRDGQFSKVVQ